MCSLSTDVNSGCINVSPYACVQQRNYSIKFKEHIFFIAFIRLMVRLSFYTLRKERKRSMNRASWTPTCASINRVETSFESRMTLHASNLEHFLPLKKMCLRNIYEIGMLIKYRNISIGL